MKKTTFLLVIVLISIGFNAFCQVNPKNNRLINAESFTPEENIFVHSNSSLLFSGEYLYYKVYCMDHTNSSYSKLSKVGYVEMIDQNKKRIFRHKIKLENGVGQGDFFIPTKLSSGNYKIIAYTQWMKNGGENYFFQEDISIVNPYKENQILADDLDNTKGINNNKKFSLDQLETRNSKIIKVSSNAINYNKRSPVTLMLKTLTNPFVSSNISLSVRKIDTIIYSEKSTAFDFKKIYKKAPKNNIYYPEINGEVISGKVIVKETNLPEEDVNVTLSIPGEGFIFKNENTDVDGIFDISISEDYDSEMGIVQVLSEDREKFKIELYETPSVNVDRLSFRSFKISPTMKKMILERSIQNQIENAYYSIKPDTIRTLSLKKSFFSKYDLTSFILDEYTHFPSTEETFLEVIDNAGTIKNESGNKVYFVRNFENNEKTLLPLIFIDGILIQEHEHLYEYNVRKIEKVSILRDEIQLGSEIYQGVILVETKEGDFKNRLQGTFIEETNLFKPEPRKDYFQQAYHLENKKDSDRIPDFRNQLLWEPNIQMRTEEKVISFFTSDVTGVFEVILEGFTTDLEPVSIKKYFVVED